MFKLVVLCAFFAVAAAKPGALLYQAPIVQYPTYVSPPATIYKHDAGLIPHAPIEYYSPALSYPHYIKKRSAVQWAPSNYPIVYANPSYHTLYESQHVLPTVSVHGVPAVDIPNVHYIKKRSAPLLPTTYFTPNYPGTYPAGIAPVLSTSYAASAPLISNQYFPSSPLISQPLTYTQFIKK